MNTHFDNHRELIIKIVDKVMREPADTRDEATRKMMVRLVERYVKENTESGDTGQKEPTDCRIEPGDIHLAILHATERALSEFRLSDNTIRKIFGILLQNHLLREKPARHEQPSCLILDPSDRDREGKLLATGRQNPQLFHETGEFFDRVVREACQLWGVYLFIVKSRDPSVYSACDIICDLAARHTNCYFFVILDGHHLEYSLIEKMAGLGNLVPVLAIHDRRPFSSVHLGAGRYDAVTDDMDRLFRAGIPFGILLAVNGENFDDMLDDGFIRYLFHAKHALFGIVSQYLPFAGHGPAARLLTGPAQRLHLWHSICRFISHERLLLLDACNENLACGCPAAGGSRQEEWFEIHGDGAVYPCHNFPYAAANLRQTYENGGRLSDIWQEPFFADIRSFKAQEQAETGAAHCLLRDEHNAMRHLVQLHRPAPAAEHTDALFHDPALNDYLSRLSAAFCSLLEQSKRDR